MSRLVQPVDDGVDRQAQLLNLLAEHIPVPALGYRLGVAYSGGVDSSTLLTASSRILGPDLVVGVLVSSQVQTAREQSRAMALAEQYGHEILVVEIDVMLIDVFRRNGPDRCHACKQNLFENVLDSDFRESHRISDLVFGENADDLTRADRPGARAAEEAGIRAPLAEAGFSKGLVRELAALLGLPNADAPSSPCLATRVPFGTHLQPQALRRIEAAEDCIHRTTGLRDLRVRTHGNLARIEVPTSRIQELLEPTVAREILSTLRSLGYDFVAVDLGGLSSGRFAALADGYPPDPWRPQ